VPTRVGRANLEPADFVLEQDRQQPAIDMGARTEPLPHARARNNG